MCLRLKIAARCCYAPDVIVRPQLSQELRAKRVKEGVCRRSESQARDQKEILRHPTPEANARRLVRVRLSDGGEMSSEEDAPLDAPELFVCSSIRKV